MYFWEYYYYFGFSISKGFFDIDSCILWLDGRFCKISFDLLRDKLLNFDFKYLVIELDVEENIDISDFDKYVMMSKLKIML